MNADPNNPSTVAACEMSHAPGSGLAGLRFGAASVLFAVVATLHPAHAQGTQPELKSAPSFVDNFSNFSQSRWFVSDGWTNGAHQNCTWSKDLVRLSDGVLSLSFEKRKLKDREFACAEIQTKQRYGYGVYEARMKTGTGSGLNAAFFSYIGPQDKQP
ncbi:MAG: glycosyl hydrolase family protein, partial [Mesorhizobium sp.]|uniref:family 16 glycosylhydrolase n=1 Tax=Mesorhizobium sp. TaxID=1871066 RepID=UPI00120F24AB